MTTNRAEIPSEYKWNLSAIYSDEQAFEADYEKVEGLIGDFGKHETTMLKGAQELCRMFEDYFAIDRLIGKLYEYASRNFDVDTTVNTYQSLSGKVMNLINQAGAASYFVKPYLMKLQKETVEMWMTDYPPLAAYRREIETTLRYQPYTLSDECEKLLADLQEGLGAASEVRGILSDSDLRFGKIRGEDGKPVELTDANYVSFLMSDNRRVRMAAFRKLYATYAQFGNTFATMMDGFVKERVALSKANHYENSLTAAVFPDEVGTDIYCNLIQTVEKHLNVLYEYYDLKKEALGVPQLHMYDVYTPLLMDFEKEYSFEDAAELVLDTVKVFGQEYSDTLRNGIFEKGWVDVYPNRGKRGGAYSAGCYDTEPYILLNYRGKFDDVSTLAHEAGHSMHSYFSRRYNAPHESSYRIFVAEVASTVNELLLARKRLRESENNAEKLSILNQLMETYKGTLFRQTMFAEFEKRMYELRESGEPLTQDMLCKTYYEIVKRYFGPRVVCDREIAYEWMRIPHFYYFFYVYKYATCISAATSVVKKIEERGQEYVEKYLNFLKCGNSKSPIESLKVAEVDLSRPEVIEDAIDTFEDLIGQFRELQKKQ